MARIVKCSRIEALILVRLLIQWKPQSTLLTPYFPFSRRLQNGWDEACKSLAFITLFWFIHNLTSSLSLNFLFPVPLLTHVTKMRLALSLSLCLVLITQVLSQELTTFWYEYIAKQGVAPYNAQGSPYQVYRNVKDFGAKGNKSISF